MMKPARMAVVAFFVVSASSAIVQAQVPNDSSGSPTSTTENPVIKGAPFSADTIMVGDIVMRNGEHQHNETHGRICRDSQGRIYLDLGYRSKGEKGVMPPILITDPVAHTLTALDPVRKSALIYDTTPRPLKLQSNGIPPPPEPRQPRPVKVEDLGTQVMEGLTVKGTRTTMTWSSESEADAPDNSYVMTSWSSDELQFVILVEIDNGKRGGSQDKKVNIVRAEPDESLFQIPSGFEVFDEREKSEASEQHEKKAAETNLPQDLTWTDPATGLMWTKQDNGFGINWIQAKQYCHDMKVKGFSDWRLPTADELNAIYDQAQRVGGYHIKGGIRLSMCCEWSSTLKEPGRAYVAGFLSNGQMNGEFGFTFRVLCVRSPEH